MESQLDSNRQSKKKITKRVRNWLAGCLVVLVVLVGAVIVWVYQQLNHETIKLGKTENELAFMSDRDGDWDLYLLDKDDQLHNLTDESGGHEYFPGFTFDGEQISMYSTATGDVTPARVDTDGTNFKTQSMIEAILDVVAQGKTDWDPAWDPGGDRMAWNKVLPGLPPKVEMFVADSNGENAVQLTDNGELEGMHAWSPDGAQLVYVTTTGGKFNTYKINVTDQTVTRLTEHDTNDYQPFWSLDGSKILVIYSFHVALVDGVTEMYVMNADGSDLHPLGEGEVFAGDLTYSPYGGQVAYVSNESGYWHIYTMNADGSNVKQLTEGNSNNLYPAWRPVPAQE
jgi:Tol biopolymer transport system component